MPESRDVQTTFTRGELDERLRGRIDVAAYRNGADKLRNVQIIPQGGARRRPGTVSVGRVPNILAAVTLLWGSFTLPNGGTAANLVDDDETVVSVTTTNIGATDDYVAFEYDFGVDTELMFFDILQVKVTATDSDEEWNLEGQVDGGSYEVIGHTIRKMSSAAQDFRFWPTQDYRKFRLVRNGTTDLGTDKVTVGEVKAYTETVNVSNLREFGFVFADDQRYLMLLTDYNLRIFRNTGGAETFAVDVPLPYPSADVHDVTYAIDKDTLRLYHNAYQTRDVLRSGDHDEWQPSKVVFTTMPQFDFGAGDEDTWSDARGWPRCGVFFQGRSCMGGSTQRPSTFMATESGTTDSLDTTTTDDNKAINVTLAPSGEEVPTIRHIVAGAYLTLFTSSDEYYHPTSDEAAITPTNTRFRSSNTRAGMDSARMTPHVIDGAIYFVQREGQSVREFVFNEVERNHSANPISLLSSHLIREPVELAFRRQLSTNDTNLLLYVNSDGTIAAFTLLRDQEIAAFTLWVTRNGDKWIGAAGVKEDLYCATERSINGVTIRYVERFDFNTLVDCATLGTAASSASVPLLSEESVAIVLDGSAQADQVATAGSVTFDRASTESFQVGLPWPDVTAEEDAYQATQGVTTTLTDGETQVWVRLLPAPGSAQDGPYHGRRRRTPECLCQFFATSSAKVERNRIAFRKLGSSLLDEPPPKFTGFKRVTGMRGWSRSAGVSVKQTEHQPFTLSSVTTFISTD